MPSRCRQTTRAHLPAKVCLLGLDSASVSLVRRWASGGQLPHLRSLIEEAAWGSLTSPPGMGDDATWASFSTCTTPAVHGRFFYRAVEPGSYDYPRARDMHLKRSPFWNALSEQGRCCAVLDVPKCPLSTRLNGLHLTDWRVHGRDQATRSWPPELAEQLQERFGDDRTDSSGPRWLCRLQEIPSGQLEELLKFLLESIEHKVTLAEELLERQPWDLFLLVFKEAHCVGHQCWHLLDPDHPAFSAELADRLGNPVLRVYQALDGAIGRLRQRLTPETHFVVFSDLDMGPNYTAEHLLDEILLGLEKNLWPQACAQSQWHRARHQVESFLRQRLSRRPPSRTVAYRHRRMFALEHNEMSGAIRLNLRGREPFGNIQPGLELQAAVQRLSEELLQLRNPASGARVVQEVICVDQVYRGENRHLLPDLLVVWNREGPIESAESKLLGRIRPRPSGFRTGNHLGDGFCLVTGPGAQSQVRFEASIMDLGPTTAHCPRLNNLPIPSRAAGPPALAPPAAAPAPQCNRRAAPARPCPGIPAAPARPRPPAGSRRAASARPRARQTETG